VDHNHRGQDFEKAGELRDKEMELKAKISAITGAAKEEDAAEAETEGVGPIVTDQDIANIVSQWTGIPIEKARVLRVAVLWLCFVWLAVAAAGPAAARPRWRR